jgi:hypothetical protein
MQVAFSFKCVNQCLITGLLLYLTLAPVLLMNCTHSVPRQYTGNTTTSTSVSTHHPSSSITPPSPLPYTSQPTLRLGDLPGYTGWARPPFTLASQFQVVRTSQEALSLYTRFTVTIACKHTRCIQGGSLFYIRAYGPSITTGQVTDYQNGIYDCTIILHDPGDYVLEVVLTFSRVPDIYTLPSADEPGYEGYLLPDFPIYIQARHDSIQNNTLPLCTLEQLTETTSSSALQSGRWVVIDKAESHFEPVDNHVTRASFATGWHSLGFFMDYQPVDCNLIELQDALSRNILDQALARSKLPDKPLHFVLVGDSNTRIQAALLKQFFGGVNVTYIATNGGLVVKLDEVKQELAKLRQRDQHNVVLFNDGLHSIFELCDYGRHGRRQEYMNISDEFTCVDTYRDYLRQLVAAVAEVPSLLTVWQTSMAAWPKWGMHGGAWPWRLQTFPLDTSMCAHFNEAALDVLSGYPSLHIMDTYWLTLARPDHRQVDEKNSLTGRLMHAGPEVYSVLTRKWAMAILDAIETYE